MMLTVQSGQKRFLVAAAGMAALVGFGFLVMRSVQATPTKLPSVPVSSVPQALSIIVEGTIVCLPDATPQGASRSAGCRLSVEADTSAYYAYHQAFISSMLEPHAVGDRVILKGELATFEEFPLERWRRYASILQGIILLTDFKVVRKSADPIALSNDPLVTDMLTYQNDTLGFSFEYPRLYQNTQCDVRTLVEGEGEGNTSLAVGSRFELSIEPVPDPEASLKAFAKNTLKDVEVTQQKSLVIAGEQALQVEYRFGGTSRYGEATYLFHDRKAYAFDWTAGGFACGFEPMVYARLLETFRFN